MKVLTKKDLRKEMNIQVVANLPNGDVKVYNIVEFGPDPTGLITVIVDGYELLKVEDN